MKKTIFYTIILLTTFSCYKNNDSSITVEITYPPKIIVTSKLTGDVVTSGPPAEYSLKVNEETYDIVNNKLPLIEISRADRDGQYFELVKEGVIVGAYHIPIIENTINYINFIIGSMPVEHVVSPNQQGIELSQTVRIDLDNVDITDESGNLIIDDFSVYFNYEEDDAINAQLISQAFDMNGVRVVVSPIASMSIQGLDGSKKSVTLDNGKATLIVDSAEEGQLMGYDKELKAWTWVSEVSAGTNEIEIPGFGNYAIGRIAPAIKLEGNILIDNTQLSYQHLDFVTTEFMKSTYSSLDGKYLVYAPQNARLDIHASDPCDNIVDSAERVTTSSEEMDNDISLNAVNVVVVNDAVFFLDCDGNTIEDAVIDLDFQSHKTSYGITSGKEFAIPVCAEKYSISARVENESGPAITWDKNRGSLHYLSTCDSHNDGYAFIRVRDDKQVYPRFTRMASGGRIEWTTSSGKFQVLMPGDIGSYNEKDINIKIEDDGFGNEGYFLSCLESNEGCGISTGEITHALSNGDEWDRIYISGEAWMRTISPPRVGNFQVEGMILVR